MFKLISTQRCKVHCPPNGVLSPLSLNFSFSSTCILLFFSSFFLSYAFPSILGRETRLLCRQPATIMQGSMLRLRICHALSTPPAKFTSARTSRPMRRLPAQHDFAVPLSGVRTASFSRQLLSIYTDPSMLKYSAY
jgi:hypothetical protein